MSQLNDFIDKENVKVLWEILVEEGVISSNQKHSNKIREIFENNMVDFYNSERSKTTSLIEMDKKYIAAMIQFLKNPNNNPSNNQQNNPPNNPSNNPYPQYKKIKIEEEIKHPITFEEIQNEKRSKFETQLQEKQKEFTNALLTPVPPTPNFKDNAVYEAPPISELENEIKRMQEQRKYDLANIQYNEEHAKKEWLKAMDTNINISKDLNNLFNNSDNLFNNSNNPLNNSVKEKDLTNYHSKHVTWAPNISSTENTFIDASLNTHTRSSEYTYLMEEIYTLKNRISDLEDRVIRGTRV
jgi:hypothetical protein